MMNKTLLCCFSSLVVLIGSCNETPDKTSGSSGNTSEPEVIQAEQKSPETFAIVGEDIVIRTGPGVKYEKLINQKATEALKKTHYAQVDYTVKVLIEESKGAWTKIRVVDPEWLSSTHIGWIPTKHIQTEKKAELPPEKLDPTNYEIIKTKHNPAVQNFHVLIKFKGFDQDKIHQFMTSFRNEHCTMYCNISVYDSKSILPLLDIYPLPKKDYIKLADHFIAMSSSDALKVKTWYPYRDFQYKEYGGKNWKTKPIK